MCDSRQNKIWNLSDRSTILAKIYIWQRRKACRTDPNFAGQGPRSGTYLEDWCEVRSSISWAKWRQPSQLLDIVLNPASEAPNLR